MFRRAGKPGAAGDPACTSSWAVNPPRLSIYLSIYLVMIWAGDPPRIPANDHVAVRLLPYFVLFCTPCFVFVFSHCLFVIVCSLIPRA